MTLIGNVGVSVRKNADGSRTFYLRWKEGGEGGTATTGVLGTLDPQRVVDAGLDPDAPFPGYDPLDTNVTKEDKVNTWTFVIRLRVEDENGLIGEQRKSVFMRRDPDRVDGFPLYFGESLEGAPVIEDIAGRKRCISEYSRIERITEAR